MAEVSLKTKAFHSVMWKIAEVGGIQVVQMVISIILARLVLPSQFGAIAMLSIFMAISNSFIDSGFSAALIRKTDRTQADCSTVFYFNIAISVVAYTILFFCAPLIAEFFNLPVLKNVLRVTSLTLVISGFTCVQSTLYRAEMNFKVLAKYNVLGCAISGGVGILLAYHDFQIWALVGQSLTYSAFTSACLWKVSKWRPSWEFSMQSLREFFGFGSKLLGSSLLDTTYNNLYGVVIGKVFSPASLAFYNRAWSLNTMTSLLPTNILQSVTYPTLCKLKDDDNVLRNGYRRILRLSAFVVFPLCLGIGAISYPLINILYTKEWIYAAMLLQIIVFGGMWYPIHAINLNLLMVKGRSDLFFRLEVIKKIIGVIMLCITVPLGLEAMCYGGIVMSILCLMVNTHYTGKLLNLGFLVQVHDFLPFLLLSSVMYAVCKGVTLYLGDGWFSLITGILVGVAIYGGGAILFRFPELQELMNLRRTNGNNNRNVAVVAEP